MPTRPVLQLPTDLTPLASPHQVGAFVPSRWSAVIMHTQTCVDERCFAVTHGREAASDCRAPPSLQHWEVSWRRSLLGSLPPSRFMVRTCAHTRKMSAQASTASGVGFRVNTMLPSSCLHGAGSAGSYFGARLRVLPDYHNLTSCIDLQTAA